MLRAQSTRARVKGLSGRAVAVPKAELGRTGRPHAVGTERHNQLAVSSTTVGESWEEGDLFALPNLHPLAWWSASRQVSFQAYH